MENDNNDELIITKKKNNTFEAKNQLKNDSEENKPNSKLTSLDINKFLDKKEDKIIIII